MVALLDELYSSTQAADYGQGRVSGISINQINNDDISKVTLYNLAGNVIYCKKVNTLDTAISIPSIKNGEIYLMTLDYKSGMSKTIKYIK